MTNVGHALKAALDFVEEASKRWQANEESHEGVARWVWVQSLLNEAIGRLNAEHLRLPTDEPPPALDAYSAATANFASLLAGAEASISHACELDADRSTRLTAGTGEMPGDRSHEASVEALRALYIARDAAQRHAKA